MRAIVKTKDNLLSCIEIEKPTIKYPNEVLVKILYSSICGTDIDRIKSKDKKWDLKILGHEAIGEVIKLGSKVDSLKLGDKVAIIPLIPCYKCDSCLSGEYALCQNYKFMGSRINGTFTEYIVVNQKNLLKVNEDRDLYKYVFLEPLTVALHAIYKTKLNFGMRVAILGAGTQGLLILQILRNLGVYEILITDINAKKLEIARTLGADHCINVELQSVSDYVCKEFNKTGIDVTFEVSGSSVAKVDSISIAKQKGTILLVGTSPEDLKFKGKTFELITRKELILKGSWMSYSAPFPGIEWLSAKKVFENNIVNVEPIITNIFKLNDVTKIINSMLIKKDYSCKLIIDMKKF